MDREIRGREIALDSIPVDAVERLVETVREAWTEDRQIFVIGNGGNAASASHFATDLGKGASDTVGRRFRIITLADNVAWLTALGNDYCYEDVFVRPLENYARPGDVLIASSVSGNSPNLVQGRRMGPRPTASARSPWSAPSAAGWPSWPSRRSSRRHPLRPRRGRSDDIYHMICYAFMERQPRR